MSTTDTTQEIQTVERTHVVVLGAGYAGAMAANRLRRNPAVDVTVVNPQPFFVQRIRLHQFIARTGEPQTSFDDVLGDGIDVVVGTATRIDADARRVHVGSGEHLDYDYLIYAIGSRHHLPDIPGAADHALSASDWAAAQHLRERIDALEPGAPVVVVGGGLTGVELAGELAERGFAVTLAGGGVVAPSVGERGHRATLRQLGRLGVDVLEDARVTAVAASRVLIETEGREQVLPSAATVFATGFRAPALAADSGLTTDGIGRLQTDDSLTSVDDDRILGAGDAVAVQGITLRMSCQAAEPLGAQVAEAVLARIAGDRPIPVDQAFVAQCTSIGRHAATLQFTRRDDSPARAVVTGRLAALAKEVVCRGTVWNIRREAAHPGAFSWLRGREVTAEREPVLQ
ncbi:NAD(P)/FAD-dependent oxidoreductase [Gordonia sp. C13]|uniref:NAD(P)/FAD-dependent oxidoreductase n=1 Tax=Gordonia sp. C13 TaxID=2935078 RepID=UPI00200A3E68|nr:FAD-dependent oxidoreductase [Gordonia sp. C13]MCK8615040.1 FAD-dependent oxidoreductase [Gordonia sp. C13]